MKKGQIDAMREMLGAIKQTSRGPSREEAIQIVESFVVLADHVLEVQSAWQDLLEDLELQGQQGLPAYVKSKAKFDALVKA